MVRKCQVGRLLGIQHASSNRSTCSATLLPTSDCAPRILAPLAFPPPWLLSARAIHRPEGGASRLHSRFAHPATICWPEEWRPSDRPTLPARPGTYASARLRRHLLGAHVRAYCRTEVICTAADTFANSGTSRTPSAVLGPGSDHPVKLATGLGRWHRPCNHVATGPIGAGRPGLRQREQFGLESV